jgi:hypothetical protein
MRRYALFLPVVLLFTSVACDDDVDGTDSSRLTLLLTDAPGDFEAAVVTISEIYLQGSPDDEDEGDRVVLLDEPVTTNLLTLANDVATLVDGAVVPAGTYGQLRFVIDGAYIEVETATGTEVFATSGYAEAPAQVDGTLMCPSCAQSGIKVNFEGGLRLDQETETLLVDFDVAETFGHEAGNSGRWIMRPSLKAADITAAASVDVSVSLASGVTLPPIGGVILTLAGFSVELKSVNAEDETPGELLVLSDANADGTFTVRFLNVLPGEYTLELRGPAGLSFGTSPGLPHTFEVESGATVTQSLTITSAVPGV